MAIATTQIVMKTGSGVPQASELAVGEIAIDIVNGELFTKDASGNVIRPNALLYLDQTDPQLSTALDANSNKIINLDTPVDDSDAATKAYVDTSMDWQRISSSGFNCERDTQYVVSILSDNPYVNLPKMTTAPEDIGAYIVLADAEGLWDQSAKHLTVNLNGNLQNQATGQLVLDIANVIVTFIWNGAAWSVYSTMAATQVQAPFGGVVSRSFEHKYVNTADTQKTTHDGVAAMQYEFYSNKQNTGLNVPKDIELNSLDLDFAYFHGKHPTTGAEYNPKVSVVFKDDDNNELKTDILVHKQEFGWGQGFEREFQQREVLVPEGATKVLVKIDNVHDDAPQDTSAAWDGKTYYNRIGIEGYWY